MTSSDPLPSPSDNFDDAEVARVAELLDLVAEERTRYRRHARARDLLLDSDDISTQAGFDEESDVDDMDGFEEDFEGSDEGQETSIPLLQRAAWFAMSYHVEVTGAPGKERVRMEPDFKGPLESRPAPTETVDDEVKRGWSLLLDATSTDAAKATLGHLLFQCGGPKARAHAHVAIDAYLNLAQTEERSSDAVSSAIAGLRLARAVGDKDRYAAGLDTLINVAHATIDRENPSLGAAREAIKTLAGEDPARAGAVIDKACARWQVGDVGDVFWHFKLKITTDEEERAAIWEKRVQVFIDMADHAGNNIVRSMRLRQALELAEVSGSSALRERAAVLVQGIRHLDLGMMKISASSHQFEEQFEEVVATILMDRDAGDQLPNPFDASADEESSGPQMATWYRRLSAFANFAPPTGDPESTRELIARQQQMTPLQAFFPKQLQTPEGLPLYAPATEDERFDLDMVVWEVQLVEQWTVFMSEALHRVVAADVPTSVQLATVLTSESAGEERVAHQLAGAFERYWSGDGQGAAYTAVPMIEALVRNAVLHADRGIFRLQRKQVPGQYVGLGALLELFYDAYQATERDQRFFNAVLRHPGGWNLRNRLAHGYLPDVAGSVGAIALYAALRVIVIVSAGPTNVDMEEQDSSDQNT